MPVASAKPCSLEWAANPDEMAIDRYHPGPAQYRRWAELVCEEIVTLWRGEGGMPASR